MPVPFTPVRMTVKISPSEEPCFHCASVRSAGFGSISSPISPSPLPVAPWHSEQCLTYSFSPAAMDASVAGTGFLIFAASG